MRVNLHLGIISELKSGSSPYKLIEELDQATLVRLAETSINGINEKLSNLRDISIPERAALPMRLMQLENPHKNELCKLAIQIVRDEFKIEEEHLAFKARLGNSESHQIQPVAGPNIPRPPSELELAHQANINKRSQDLPANNETRLEVSKRILVNSIIQGAAHFVQSRFLLETMRISEINPRLINPYCEIMPSGDAFHWEMPLHFYDQAPHKMPPAGLVKVKIPEASGDTITVDAWGAFMPVLIHELAKGVVETLALGSLPKDKNLRNQVLAQADRVEYEPWCLRIGPAIWEKINLAIGTKPEESAKRNWALRKLFELDSKLFISTVIKIIKSDSAENAKNILRQALGSEQV